MPEELARAHIQTWSNKGDLVIDPFMGAGTTAQMCVEEGRNFIGFEIDSEYHEMCIDRAKSSVPHLLTSLVPVE